MARYAHVDGELCPLEEATVPVSDRGFLYGDAAFETLRAYGGHLFAWDAHADRLEGTCAALGMDHDLTSADLYERIHRTLEANDLRDAYVRLAITRGRQPGRLTPQPEVDPTVVILVEGLSRGGVDGESTWDAPAAITIVDRERVPDAAIPAAAKTHNYLNGILARLDARAYDEAIMVDGRGAITEGATSNLFVVVDGVLKTPPVDRQPVLPGITRATVLDLAAGADIETEETVLYPLDLREADELFLTNSTWEIRPVTALDDVTFEVGATTTALADAFDHLVEQRCYLTCESASNRS